MPPVKITRPRGPLAWPPDPPSRGAWALVGLALLGVGLRLWRAHNADWYWDEGYLADLVQDLARFQRPHSGALWFNGVLPLTTSWLAPVSAVPLLWLFPTNAIAALRVWGALLGGISILFLGLAGKRLGGWSLGLGAALLLAVGPFPVALGGLALYHHLATALALAALWAALPPGPGEKTAPPWLPWLLAGGAAAAAYWLWWVPLAQCFRPASAKPVRRTTALLLGFGPLALMLALTLVAGGSDALAMWRGMLAWNYTSRYLADLSKFQSFYPVPWKAAFGPFGSEVWAFLKDFPVAWLGLGGLFLLGPRQARSRVWLGPVLGMADLFRQRGNPLGSVYAFTPLIPWFCLGLALAAERLASIRRGYRLIGLAAAALLLSPCHLLVLDRLSVPPPMVRNLQAYLRAQSCVDDTVVTAPNVGWRLRQVCRPVETCQAAAARGWQGGLLPAQLSSRAFAYDPSLDKARFLVTCQENYAFAYAAPHVGLELLVAEYEAWPKVFENPSFRVYANPRFGPKPFRHPIVGDPQLYRQAAVDAKTLGRLDWAAYALSRANAAPAVSGP